MGNRYETLGRLIVTILAPLLLFYFSSTVLPAYSQDAKILGRVGQTGPKCTAVVGSSVTISGSYGEKLRLVSSDGIKIKLAPKRTANTIGVSLVFADNRLPFTELTFPSSAQLLNSDLYLLISKAKYFHITREMYEGVFRSSLFKSEVILSTLEAMANQCNFLLEEPSAEITEKSLELSRLEVSFISSLLSFARTGNPKLFSKSKTLSDGTRNNLVHFLNARYLRPSRYLSSESYQAIYEYFRILVPPRFEDITSFENNLAGAKIGGKWGVISQNGKWIVRPVYLDTMPPANGFIPVENTKGWKFVSRLGAELETPTFSELGSCSEFACSYSQGGKHGLFWPLKGRRSKAIFDKVTFSEEGFSVAKRDGSFTQISPAGSSLYTLTAVSDLYPHSNGSALVKTLGGRYYFVDKMGNALFGGKIYNDALPFSSNYAGIKLNGKWGFISRLNGQMEIPPTFVDIGYFRDRIVPAKLSGLWGIANTSGRWVLKPSLEYRPKIVNGIVLTKNAKNQWGLIDVKNGSENANFLAIFSDVKLSTNLFAFKYGKRWGLSKIPLLNK